jgi:hypothetical protein
MSSDPAEMHPDWCAWHFCTANQAHSGAHRSRPIIVNERPLLLTVSLYAEAAVPADVCVEVRKNHVLLALLPSGVARSLGRVLASVGAAGERVGQATDDRTGDAREGDCG